jgi:drug/metabolite transporter (DMT)-like permease
MYTEQPLQILRMIRTGEVVEIGGGREVKSVVTSDSLVPLGRLSHPSRSTRSDQKTASYLQVAFALAAIYLIWGSTYLAIRYAVEAIPPLLMMGLRHFTAGAMLYAWLRWRGTPAPLGSHWKAAMIAGAIFFLGAHGSLAWAEERVPSGLAALLNATLPLWIVLLTWMQGQRRVLSRAVLAGLVLGFVGVVVLIGPASLQAGAGLFYTGVVLVGALLWAVGTIYTQRATLPESAMLSAAMQMLAGGVALFAASLLIGERVHASQLTIKSVLSLAYLIVFGSLIAFSAFTWLHQVAPAARISTFAYVNPVVAVFLGWFLAGEAIGVRTIVATAIILSGVALVNRKPKELSDESGKLAHHNTAAPDHYQTGHCSAAD